MKVGFVHARAGGTHEGGVTRYGRILASEIAQNSDLNIQERELVLSGDLRGDLNAVRECGAVLASNDLLHVQFSRYIWGTGSIGKTLLRELRQSAKAPLIVTFHDVQPDIYPSKSVPALFQESFHAVRATAGGVMWPLWRAFRLVQRGYLRDRQTLRWIAGNTTGVIVCTHEEKQRLVSFFEGRSLTVIPHFIENRRSPPSRQTARRELGLDAFKTVVLLGFVYPGKGHEVALAALRLLPPEYLLVFAGGATGRGQHYLRGLEKQARDMGLAERLRITGFLSEAALESYLVAADTAICPFIEMSASGSLSTWLSLGTVPIIASTLPQIQSYTTLAPDAISLFPTGDHTALAGAILTARADETQEARSHLRELLSVRKIAEAHCELYSKQLHNAGSG